MRAYATKDDLNKDTPPQTDFHTADYRSKITSITTKNDNIVPETAVESWDISEAGNGSVMAYVEKTDEVLEPMPGPTNAKIYSNDDRDKDISKTIYATPLSETNTNYAYKLTIGGKGGIIANESMIYYFAYFNRMRSIDLSALDTSEVTNMNLMFGGGSDFPMNVVEINISNFDTSKVTDMSWMFGDCRSLTSLDVSNFDTLQVTNMQGMFYGCSRLTSLDVSKFDTSKVTNMENMFCDCPAWDTVDQTKFAGANECQPE